MARRPLPTPDVMLVDPDTGLIASDWHDYFRDLHATAGAGGTSFTEGDKGDITVSSTWTIDPDSVTYAKMQNVSAASRLIGRGSLLGAGDPEEITLGTNLSMSGTVLNVSSGTATVGDGDYGDITVTVGGTTWTIDPGAVTYAKLQSTGAPSVLLGRGDSGAGSPQEITLGSNLSMSGTTLNASGAGGVTDGDKGDITVTVGGTTWTIDPGAVTYAKIQNVGAASVLIGRGQGGGGGVPQEITLGVGLSMLGTVMSSSGGSGVTDGDKGDITVTVGGTTWTIDPGAVTYAKIQNVGAISRLLGRGDSGVGPPQEIILGSNLSMSGTTLNAAAGGGGSIERQVTGINLATGDKYAVDLDGSGASNMQPIIQAAWNACGLIYLPSGVFRIDSPLVGPLVNGAGIIGASGARRVGAATSNAGTEIRANFTAGTAITSANNLLGPTFQNLTITRVGVATSGSNGLYTNVSCDAALLYNLWVLGHDVGIRLGNVGYGRMEWCRSENNLSHGFQMFSQWQISNCFSANNAGHGWYVIAPAGFGQSTCGQWSGMATFRNSGSGLVVQGSNSEPIAAMRLSNSFFGEDHQHEVIIDSYGRLGHYAHVLTHVYAELGGFINSVPTFAATGFVFTGNCPEVSMINCSAIQNTSHGVVSDATWLTIQGGQYNVHKSQVGGGNGFGILVNSGKASIMGAQLFDNDIGIIGTDDCTALTYHGNYNSFNTTPADVGSVAGPVSALGNY